MKKIELNIDTRDAVQSISDLERQLDEVKGQLENLGNSEEDVSKSTEDLGNKYADLNSKLQQYERETQNVSRAITTQTQATTQLNSENQQATNNLQQLSEKAIKAAQSFSRMLDGTQKLASSFSDGSSSFKAFENVAGSTAKVLADISSKNYLGAIINLASAWRDWGQVIGFSADELDRFASKVRAFGSTAGKALISPFKSLFSLLRGEGKQALQDIKDGFSFSKNWNQAIYNDEIKQAWKKLGDDGVEAWKRIRDAADDYAGATLDHVIEREKEHADVLQKRIKEFQEASRKEAQAHQSKIDRLNKEIDKEKEKSATIKESLDKEVNSLAELERKRDEAQKKMTEAAQRESKWYDLISRINNDIDFSRAYNEFNQLDKSVNKSQERIEDLSSKYDEINSSINGHLEEVGRYSDKIADINAQLDEAEKESARVAEAEEERIRKAKEETVGTAEYAAAQEKKAQDERVLAANEAYQELQRIQEEWRRQSQDSFQNQIQDLVKQRDEMMRVLNEAGDSEGADKVFASFQDQIDKLGDEYQKFLQEQEDARRREADREAEIAQAAAESQEAAERRLQEERARIWKDFSDRQLSDKGRELQAILDLEKKYLASLDTTAKDYSQKRAQIEQWSVNERAKIEENYRNSETAALNKLADEWKSVQQLISDSRLTEEERALAEIDRQEKAWLEKYGDYENAKTEITKYSEEQRQKIREQYEEQTEKLGEKENLAALKNITSLAAGASGALQTLTAGFSLLGIEMGDDIKIIKTLQSLMAMTSGIVAVEKGVIAFKKLADAIKLSTVYIKLATVATKGWAAAIISTGIGALVVLLGVLIAQVSKLTEKYKEASQEVKDFNAQMQASLDAKEGWDEHVDYVYRLAKAYGKAADECRRLRLEALATELDKAWDDEYEAQLKLLELNKKLEKAWGPRKKQIQKEIEETTEIVNKATERRDAINTAYNKRVLEDELEVIEERKKIQSSWTSQYRSLVEGRLKLDISYFEHLRSQIDKNYTIWQEQQARTWDPNRTKVGEYEEELRKITKVLQTYQDQMKAVDGSREKRRKALQAELNQRLKNQEITSSQLKQELEQFDSSERATMDALQLQIAQLKLSWSQVNQELKTYRAEIELNSKISNDNISNTLDNLEIELEYLQKRREYMKPDPSWYEPVSGWWNETDQENLDLEHERAQLELQQEIYQQELENLQYQLDNKLIAYQEYLEKKTELESQITLNEEEQADIRVKIAKNEADKKKLVNNLYYKFLQNITSSISSILGSVADTMEEGTQQWKALKYAQVIIDTLAGSIAAFVSNLSAFPAPYNLIAGGIAAASVIATGIATANQIANTEVSKNATPSSNASVSYLTTNISNVRQTTTASDYQELRDNDMAAGDIRVIVYESDITDAQNSVRANVEQNTY